jgi:hypothetical protein
MVNVLALLLPCLFPSWAFFETIEPSPRLEWRRLKTPNDMSGPWTLYRPKPAQVSTRTMALRLFWNPQGNDDLYLVSLAERLVLAPHPQSLDAIHRRIALAALHLAPATSDPGRYLQFRLLFVHREGRDWVTDEGYVSAPRLMAARLL